MASATYTDEQQTRGLLALVACAGSASAAAQALEQQGHPIPVSTLRTWTATRRDELDGLRDRYAPQLEEEIVRQLRDLALYAPRVQRKAIELAEERLDAGKDINPAQTAASLAKVAANATDKLLALTGRPTQITEHRSVEEITRGLVAAGVLVLDTASEAS